MRQIVWLSCLSELNMRGVHGASQGRSGRCLLTERCSSRPLLPATLPFAEEDIQ
jgi:hypothetical protein